MSSSAINTRVMTLCQHNPEQAQNLFQTSRIVTEWRLDMLARWNRCTVRRTVPVTVILPCLNEAEALPGGARRDPGCLSPLVVDNNSTDGTAEVARGRGADVVFEPVPGYGSAVHAGVAAATTPIVAVIDGTVPWIRTTCHGWWLRSTGAIWLSAVAGRQRA